MAWPMFTSNFPISMNPIATKFIIPGVNMHIDLGQFMNELMKLRCGNEYDKAYLKQVMSTIVAHAMSLYFINAINTFILAYGFMPSHQLSVIEFNHIYSLLNDQVIGTNVISNEASPETSSTMNNNHVNNEAEVTPSIIKANINENKQANTVPEPSLSCFHSIPVRHADKQTETIVDDAFEELKSKLEEAVRLIPEVPTDKLDLALSLVLKKTYFMDKKIRNRMYRELIEVKEQVDELRMSRHQIKEKEEVTKKVRIFLGRK